MPASQTVFEPSLNYDEVLRRVSAEQGINHEYWDIFGRKHVASRDVEQRLLAALGIDVSTQETLSAEWLNALQRTTSSALPPTIVVGTSDKSAPVTLPGDFTGPIGFNILLEGGGHLGGAMEVSSLPVSHELQIGDRQWLTRVFSLPQDTPLGYHTLTVTIDGRSESRAHLVVCPDQAFIPSGLADGHRTAGLNVTLYGLRSERNWGCGDFSDLRTLIDWAGSHLGVTFIGLNPLHAIHNRFPYNTSPYLPLSIFYKNFIYIDMESVPEFQTSSCAKKIFQSTRVQETIRSLRMAEFVEYEQIDRLKRRFLKLLFREFRRISSPSTARGQAFSAYCEREGDLLHKFALYCALDEVLHKQDRRRWTWHDWPEPYRTPDSNESKQFAEERHRTIDFYKYIQFVIEEQLSAAQAYAKQRGLSTGLYHDLALATDSRGSDLWAHRDFFVNGCRVGSPPDDFSPNGQDWAFPPPNSTAHWLDGYRLFRESIRKIVRHGGALRIDHVMRLFRLFWIPNSVEAADGTYVRDRAADLMHILALESVRSENIVVGEDLGTVTDEMRDMLARFGILSYRLFYFERHRDGSFKSSGEYPRQALVASTTHDLPTIAGFWTHRDIEARRAAGLADEQSYRRQLEDRRRDKQNMLDRLHAENLLPQNYPRDAEQVPQIDGDLHNAIIGFLAQVPSMLLLLNQEDLTKETEQQNLPGSTAEYPNWRRKMKLTLEELSGAASEGFAAMFRHQLTRVGRK
jgi:4-alpha-glucanotransferase